MSTSTDQSLRIAAGDLELAEAALNNAAERVRTHDAAREVDNSTGSASNDAHILLRLGQLRARLHAAHGLLSRAVRLRDHTRSTGSEETIARIVALQAQAFARDLTLEINNQLTIFGATAPIDWRSSGVEAPTLEGPNHLLYESIGRYYLQAELAVAPESLS